MMGGLGTGEWRWMIVGKEGGRVRGRVGRGLGLWVEEGLWSVCFSISGLVEGQGCCLGGQRVGRFRAGRKVAWIG